MKSARWTPERIHRHRWWTLAAICLAVTITSIDNTIMNVGLPSIVRGLGASQAQLQWLLDSYTIVFACLLLTMGAIGDKWGRHHMLRIGLVLFGIFSAFACFANTTNALIICGVHLSRNTCDSRRYLRGRRTTEGDRHLGGGGRRWCGCRPVARRFPADALLVGLDLPHQRSALRYCCRDGVVPCSSVEEQ
jgi:hypothetical protein